MSQMTSYLRPKRTSVRIQVIILVVLPVVVAPVFLWQTVGPGGNDRESALRIMRNESAALPPFQNAQITDQSVRDVPLYPPNIARSYTLAGSCSEAQAYYASLTQANGWTLVHSQTLSDPTHPNDPSHTTFRSEYRKTVMGKELVLVIECFEAADTGYSFFMEAP